MPDPRRDPPLVSVVMALHNGAPHLADAMASVLAQSHGRIELLLCDDASTDDGPGIARTIALADRRVRILTRGRPSGPGAARNRGLDAAQGDWIAVVDADDLLHPDRIAGLLDAAGAHGADLVADDLVPFGAESGTTLLSPLQLDGPWRPDARALLRADQAKARAAVGYLKPMVRRSALGSLRYREDLRIGEDFDLLLRLVLSGAQMLVVPSPRYLYRRHSGSTSHRLKATEAAAIGKAIDALAADFPDWAAAAAPELDTWHARTARASAFGDLVAALKAGEVGRAATIILGTPGLATALARAASEGVARRLRRAAPSEDRRPLVLASRPDSGRGLPFAVPGDPAGWTPARVVALAKVSGSGRRHLRVVGRPGLDALGYVPGWRLAELVPPPDGWTDGEAARIAALPWPVLRAEDICASPAAAGPDATKARI